jgi:hypothetical protein
MGLPFSLFISLRISKRNVHFFSILSFSNYVQTFPGPLGLPDGLIRKLSAGQVAGVRDQASDVKCQWFPGKVPMIFRYAVFGRN